LIGLDFFKRVLNGSQKLSALLTHKCQKRDWGKNFLPVYPPVNIGKLFNLLVSINFFLIPGPGFFGINLA
jgi:hypothetical protein